MMKWTRRYGIPLSSAMFLYVHKKKEGKEKWRALIIGWLLIALSIGYGQNSTLFRILGGKDWLVRIVYGLIISVPFLFWGMWYASPVLALAYSFRAGGFKIGDKFDFLFEDFVRFSVIGTLVFTIIR